MKWLMRAAALAATAMAAACAVGPNYQKPPPTLAGVPESWHARLPHDGAVTELAQWWRHFDDPLLIELVDTAESFYPSIDSAVGALREARAADLSARAGFLPRIDAAGSITRNGSSASSEAASTGLGSDTSAYTLSSGALDASWELDVFGGLRRSHQASQARIEAATANWHDARVSLAAEVADAYVERRYCERLLQLYQDTLRSRRETERLTALKVRAGFASPADEAQARAGAYDSENQLIAQEGICVQDLNRLVALTGWPVERLSARLADTAVATAPAPAGSGAEDPASTSTQNRYRAGIPVPLHPIVPGVPAAILSQRPDLMASERELAAASADIGVAQASRLPSLTLFGNIAFNRVTHVDGSARSWSWGPSLDVPLFEGGAGLARVQTANARYAQALASYRLSVLNAVQETENALARVDASVRRAEAARLSEENYSRLLLSQENRYRSGATSLLDLEDSRRLALSSREQLAAVQSEISRSWIALYKAVGGGWQNDPLPPDVAAAESPPPNPVVPEHAAVTATEGAGA